MRPERAAAALRVSAYDRTFSLLIALLLLVGGAVIAITFVYFAGRLQRTPPAIPVMPVSAGGESRAASDGEVNELTPSVENAPSTLEPDMDQLLEQISLAATSDAVLMPESTSSKSSASEGEGGGDGRGVGDGDGDTREPRREIYFEPRTVKEYAQWFDAAGLELGVLGSDNLVYYATQLSTPSPKVRTGKPEDEIRLYFNSMGGPLYVLDKKLAEKAGILGKGTLVLQFCTPETQQRLLQLERERAGDRLMDDIARTVFKVVRRGNDFGFEVSEQQYYR